MGLTPTRADLVEVIDVATLRQELAPHRRDGVRIGFVPTMGALHDGHAELIRAARRDCDVVVTSCYVNPTQFRPGEDLDRYPRTPELDRQLALEAGADLLWRPRTVDLYGDDPSDAVRICVGAIGTILEGASRPGHFDGVATVVVRLLAAVEPAALYLGEKDFQQVVVLERVVRDLLLPVEVRTVPTVREPDGLARSSRNAYLDERERRAARAIPAAIDSVRRLVDQGERDPHVLLDLARSRLHESPGILVDYVELVDAHTLQPATGPVRTDCVLLVAARVGATRLIDNLPIRQEHA